MNVPDDLKGQYELNKKWLALPYSDRPPSRSSVEAILRSDCVQMAERIARLEGALTAVRHSHNRDVIDAALNPPPASEKERVG